MAWEEGQPSSAWLQQLWDLLVGHPDLRPLEGWPLLPVAGPLLARLHPASQVPQWPGLGEPGRPPHLFNLLCVALAVMLAAERPGASWLRSSAAPVTSHLMHWLQVVKEGSWAEAAGTAISKLGCRLLDASKVNIKHPQASCELTCWHLSVLLLSSYQGAGQSSD